MSDDSILHEKSGAPLGPGMVSVRVTLPAREVVFFKGVIEAHDGLAQIYAEKGGDLVVCTTESQCGELRALLEQLAECMQLFLHA